MRLLSSSPIAISTTEMLRVLVIAISLVIISSSMMLFITDRGNIISYSLEHIHGWKNPTYEEMQVFLASDTTDLHPFIEGTYECKQFCFDLIRNARQQGYRAGYVTLSNPQGDDHAIVCFDTIDVGLVFVEPQLDLILSTAHLSNMLTEQSYSIPVKGLGWESTMPLDNVHISWYMVI